MIISCLFFLMCSYRISMAFPNKPESNSDFEYALDCFEYRSEGFECITRDECLDDDIDKKVQNAKCPKNNLSESQVCCRKRLISNSVVFIRPFCKPGQILLDQLGLHKSVIF